jgi:hypothetical protein
MLSSLFLTVYFSSIDASSGAFWVHNWYWGLVTAGLAGAFLVKNILSQPFSRNRHGIRLAGDVLWFGLAYGIVDGLFLNVMPVVALRDMFSESNMAGEISGQLLTGFLALCASLVITLFYHLGYPEFRNKSVLRVLLGNTIITLTFIVSGNPLAAVLAHTIMHVAAVFRGPETTLQLPPHYT